MGEEVLRDQRLLPSFREREVCWVIGEAQVHGGRLGQGSV